MNTIAPRATPTATDLVVTLEPMRRRHLRAVLGIERQAPHRGWSAGLFLGELARTEDRRYLVAKVGHTVVGFGGLMLVGPDAHVTTLSVDPPHQQSRVGTRLMLAFARQAYCREAENLTLEVRASNAPAIALYRRFGLAPAGIRKNYYADLGEDALVMWGHDVHTREFVDRLDAIEAALPGQTRTEGVLW